MLVIGGGRRVPGGIQLTVEAALRAGAGKIQVVTIESATLALGIAMPEVAVFGMPESAGGEIVAVRSAQLTTLIEKCDCVVAGPAMSDAGSATKLVRQVLADCETDVVLDAAALMKIGANAHLLGKLPRPAVLTPHIGELAAMLGQTAAEIEQDRIGAVSSASAKLSAVCAFKGATTLIAAPDGQLFSYAGGGVGLATGGSGDVLAGIVAGLCARGASPIQAALWAVWLHGEAGRRCAEEIGSIGFLARELLAHLPRLMHGI